MSNISGNLYSVSHVQHDRWIYNNIKTDVECADECECERPRSLLLHAVWKVKNLTIMTFNQRLGSHFFKQFFFSSSTFDFNLLFLFFSWFFICYYLCYCCCILWILAFYDSVWPFKITLTMTLCTATTKKSQLNFVATLCDKTWPNLEQFYAKTEKKYELCD